MSESYNRLCYLATPYTLYPYGFDVAARDAAAIAGNLMRRGLNVYSPIVYGHQLSLHGGVDPRDMSIWTPVNRRMMVASDILIVAHMVSWQESRGIADEVEWFAGQRRPIYDLNPNTMTMVQRQDDALARKTGREQGGSSC